MESRWEEDKSGKQEELRNEERGLRVKRGQEMREHFGGEVSK